MPTYEVTNDEGITLRLTGKEPPTKEQLDKIFAQQQVAKPQDAPATKTPEEEVSPTENFWRTFGGAGRDVAQATLDVGEDIRGWMPEKLRGGGLVWGDDKGVRWERREEFDKAAKPLQLDTIPEPTYTGGSLVRDLSGFMVPYAGASKAIGGVKTIKGALGTGTVAEQFAFSPDEQRLSNLVADRGPEFAKPFAEFLQANPDDPAATSRFKMALEGAGLGAVVEGLMLGARSLRAKQKANKVNEPVTDQPAVSATNQTPVVKPEETTIPQQLREIAEPLQDVTLQQKQAEPGLLGKHYQKLADNVINYTKKKASGYSELGSLSMQDEYLTLKGLAGGKTASIKKIAENVYDSFSKIKPGENLASLEYLTGKSGLENISDPVIRSQSKELRSSIDQVGELLVGRGILPRSIVEANSGTYLPRTFLKHLGKNSRMGYTMKRKDLDEQAKNFLGEIKDVGLLGAKAIEGPMSDIIQHDFFRKITQNPEWAYQGGLVNFRGKKVSPVWLKDEGDRILKEINDGLRPKKDMTLVRSISKQVDEANLKLEEAKITKEGSSLEFNNIKYKQMPKSKSYGDLRGAYVRKEIHDDLVGANNFSNPDSGLAQSILGDGGTMSTATKLWKMSKVALNPPTQIRNAVSNVMLLNLSGVRFRDLPSRLTQAMGDIKNGGPYSEIARKYGIIDSTFAKQEMLEINKAYLKSKAKRTGNLVDQTKYIAGTIADSATNAYQAIEVVGKTAKIIDEMAKGVDEATAALNAQKTLFDYSLVPLSIRYLRNAPVGMPFATFYYKVLPNLLETAVRYPERYAPYIALPYAYHTMLAAYEDVSNDDFEKLIQSLPEYLRDRDNALALPVRDKEGRWQFLDFSYFLPWSMFTGMVDNVADGDVKRLFNETGIFGGPLPQIITALQTNIDPFTQREIVNEYDPPSQKLADAMLYAYRMAMPTWLTDIGFAGKLLEAINNDVNRFGDPKTTVPQAVGRLVGFNIYPIDPTQSRATNLKFMKQDITNIKSRRTRVLRDKNLTNKERKEINQKYKEMIEHRVEQLKQYQQESRLPEKLK